MSERIKNIIAAIVCLYVPFIYFWGVFSYRNTRYSSHQDVVDMGEHIYFVCFSSALYAASAIGVLLAKPKWLWILAIVTNSVCLVILYEEIAHGDSQWTKWSWKLIPLVAANCIILYELIRKVRKKLNYGR